MSEYREGTERVVLIPHEEINDSLAAREISVQLVELIDSETDSEEGELETLHLDLHQIDWISSVGLNELIGIHRRARSRGIRLVLSNVRESVRDVFALTRLERTFEVEPQ